MKIDTSTGALVVTFHTSEPRPTLPAKPAAAHRAIVALLREYSPHVRETILANACTSVQEINAEDRRAVRWTP